MSEFKHPIRKFRDKLKITQDELGVMLSVDGLTVSRWERGESVPRRGQWTLIEDVTGITPAQLIAAQQNLESAR
jgi:DNA-binding transcriptional regulator YiaG